MLLSSRTRGAALLAAAASAGGGLLIVSSSPASPLPLSAPPPASALQLDSSIDGHARVDLRAYRLEHHLLHTALAGEGKLERYELYVSAPSAGAGHRSALAVARLGSRACGHPAVVHGGAIAALLDDVFGCAFFASALGTGFTANLSVDYRKPLPPGTLVHVRARVDRVEPSSSGRSKKVFLVGSLVDAADGTLYTEAKALFIVKTQSPSLWEKVMGLVGAGSGGGASFLQGLK